MKTTTFFTLVALLIFSQIANAQQEIDLQELLQRLHGNHMGSIHDVFSQEEITTLQAHFDKKNGTITTPRAIQGGMFYRATENTQGNSAVINTNDLSMIEIVAPSPLMEFEGAGATIPGTPRAVVVDNNNNFYIVDSTGNYTFVDQIEPANGQSFTGLEYTSDGALYGIATDGMGSTTLYEIDLLTAQATAVGTENGLVVGIALGRDMDNNLYSYDIDTNLVYRIDRLTGAPTLLGPIGFNAEFGQGMSYDSSTNTLLASAFNSDTFKPELRSINTTTGTSTLLGVIVPALTLQFAWMSKYDPSLGVTDISTERFTLYPNPTTNLLTISALTNIETITIYNSLGQLILQQEETGNTASVDVSELASGLYIVQVGTGHAQNSQQFIKH
ncbi:MAG TPA: T9SS type A sorting domain-containing protein [Flavobacteriaceae bacterium]|nr:T9SS type A sorting domain-containing protein [Flavobacteriaceae bacterium]HIN98722.1 T9SS type A sorting domain-containing protein [Flavobacteriaceae bacterium]